MAINSLYIDFFFLCIAGFCIILEINLSTKGFHLFNISDFYFGLSRNKGTYLLYRILYLFISNYICLQTGNVYLQFKTEFFSPFTYTLSCPLKKSILTICFSIEIIFFPVFVPLLFFSLRSKLEPYTLRSYFLFMYFSEDDTV